MTDPFDMILQRGFVFFIFIIMTVITILRDVLFPNIVVQSIFPDKSKESTDIRIPAVEDIELFSILSFHNGYFLFLLCKI